LDPLAAVVPGVPTLLVQGCLDTSHLQVRFRCAYSSANGSLIARPRQGIFALLIACTLPAPATL
jgi:hypothetical protein